jgi:hypothetical protein
MSQSSCQSPSTSIFIQVIEKYEVSYDFYRRLKFVQRSISLKSRRHFLIVCKAVKQLLTSVCRPGAPQEQGAGHLTAGLAGQG